MVTYDRQRMFDSSLRPWVLELDDEAVTLQIRPNVSGPPELGLPARLRTLHIFNPSIASAPADLCPRCSHVVALRADALHQCDASSPLLHREDGMPSIVARNAWFKSTIIAALDQTTVLGWTWLLVEPERQISNLAAPNRWFVPPGVSDDFQPPWGAMSYDARLIGYKGRLFATWLRSCHERQPCDFSVSQLQLTAVPTLDGGLTQFRAWALRPTVSRSRWAQGRNQALFVVRSTLMVQPWLGMVAAFDDLPAKPPRRVRCYARRSLPAWQRRRERVWCGPTPRAHSVVIHEQPLGSLSLLQHEPPAHSSSEALAQSEPRQASIDADGRTHSPTANLIRISSTSAVGSECAALLGVAHVHLGEGHLNRRFHRDRSAPTHRQKAAAEGVHRTVTQTSAQRASAKSSVFMFGYDYQHYFYTLSATPPHHMIGKSASFCIASAQDKQACESIQFISGISLTTSCRDTAQDRDRTLDSKACLLLSYGINDCEAKIGHLALRRVWEMLKPLHNSSGACVDVSSRH